METAMLIDIECCLGCNACTVECKRNNDVPVGEHIAWTKIEELERGTYPTVIKHYVKEACKHCTDASCMNVCPVGAISKPDGVHVVVDGEWCIGCGNCKHACPFGIPHFTEPKHTMQKCRFCYGNKAEDEPTACATACPFGAITFGERNDLIETGHQRVADLKAKGLSNATLYGENELGGLHVLYVISESPENYGLPESPQVTSSSVIGKWLTGVTTAGVIAALPLWFVFKRKQELESRSKGGA